MKNGAVEGVSYDTKADIEKSNCEVCCEGKQKSKRNKNQDIQNRQWRGVLFRYDGEVPERVRNYSSEDEFREANETPEKLQESINCLQTDIAKIKFEFASQDQRSRLNNVEIKGVPLKKDENLFSIFDSISRKIKYNCPKTQINYISRVPIYNSSERLIIVSFLNRYSKEDFIAAARANRDLSAPDIGYQGSSNRIYINDHLSVEHKKLLSRVKAIAKEKSYEYVWFKHGKIHALKNQSSKLVIIRKDADLNKIA
ncbi:uncharacterized protein LOC113495137 [Trichoplusia ni]|uniref:Uncharacterized protein LOC113495137 n=1 Tax=Trichoplusia ni TaxID=7111 RepID=A0A7E5VMJ1_TRINI|nr:uncharacterized protein LOC113495137 [Trichoplusia ni]